MRAILKGMKDVYALDLGTTKFCLASLRPSSPSDHPTWKVDHISVPAEGMRRGMVASIDEARCALDQLMTLAERSMSPDVRKVVVGIAGSHLRGRSAFVRKNINQGQVTGKDLLGLSEHVERENTINGREVLHTIPLGYSIDGRPKVENPLGLHGKNIEAHYFLIDADQAYLRDVLHVCNAVGLQVVRFYSEPVASASVTIPDNLKENGVAMADIGGGTTDGIVFRSGRPVAIFTIDIGGKLMTNDLAVGLGLSPSEAEKAKMHFGIVPSDSEQHLPLIDLHGSRREIKDRDMGAILLPRVHELGVMMGKSLLPYRGSLGSGLFLTGGGSEVKGLPEYFKSKMGIPVFKAKPILPSPHEDMEVNRAASQSKTHPTHLATVLGLLNLEIGRIGDQYKYRENTWSSRYLGPVLNWLKELA